MISWKQPLWKFCLKKWIYSSPLLGIFLPFWSTLSQPSLRERHFIKHTPEQFSYGFHFLFRDEFVCGGEKKFAFWHEFLKVFLFQISVKVLEALGVFIPGGGVMAVHSTCISSGWVVVSCLILSLLSWSCVKLGSKPFWLFPSVQYKSSLYWIPSEFFKVVFKVGFIVLW